MVSKDRQALTPDDTCDVRVIHLDRVNRARTEAIRKKELEHLARTYRVMGDPSRLKIIMALAGGEMCVCDLAAYSNLSESAVSHQLRQLKDLAIVRNRREGKILYYRLDDSHVSDLLKTGLEHIRE